MCNQTAPSPTFAPTPLFDNYVIDPDTGDSLEYFHLMVGPDK